MSGNVSFDAATKTLTLDNATIVSTKEPAIRNNQCEGLVIKVLGKNDITTTKAVGVYVVRPTTVSGIGGSSLLNIKAGNSAMHMSYTPLTIQDCDVTAVGTYGISGYGINNDVLTIRNSRVKAKGGEGDLNDYEDYGSITDLNDLVLECCHFHLPGNAMFNDELGGVVEGSGGWITTDMVVIEPDCYDIWVADKEVTTLNYKDLSGIKGVSGTVSYDPNTKTLTLDNATITNEDEGYGKGIVNKNISDFTIRLIGENTVTTGSASLVLNQPSTITGEGSLSLSSQKYCGLDMEAASVLIDNTKLFVRGAYGIAGYEGAKTEVLTVHNSYVEAEGFALGSIVFLSDLILEDCSITQPDGAEFDAGKRAVVLNGEEVKSKVVIAPAASGISDITVDASAHAKGIYSVTGVKQTQQWNELPAGIYIVDGVKRVKK